MQPKMCSRCHKNIAVVFITKLEGDKKTDEGLCLNCARKMGIKPVDDMLEKMGISSDEDLENLSNEMLGAFGGMEALEDMQSNDNEEDDSDDNDSGKTATFPPFFGKLFGALGQGNNNRNNDNNHGSAESNQGSKESKSNNSDAKQDKKQPKNKFLDTYCTSLTNKARSHELDNVIGREEEISRVIQILNRRQKNNPCLIGEPGVGKTAIAEGLAQRIVSGNVPYKLANKEVYLLDLTSLVAGTQFRGQFESRMKGLITEVKRLGNIILVIDEVHNLVGAGDAEGSMNAANILKPALSRGEIQVIGATTFNEYRKHIEKDTALERRFQPVTVAEPSIDDTVKIIRGIAHYYENFHSVVIPDLIAREAVLLSERYITDRYLPDKAIDLIDEACSDVNLHNKNLASRAFLEKECNDYKHELDYIAENSESFSEEIAAIEKQQSRCRQELSSLNNTRQNIQTSYNIPEDESKRNLEENSKRIEQVKQKLNDLQQKRRDLQNESDRLAFEQRASVQFKLSQAEQKLEEAKKIPYPELQMENLAGVIEKWTGIPASRIEEAEFERLSKLDVRLKHHIIGQDKAVDAVTRAIRRNRVGISPKQKPVSFIFVGPTGVGKTELVKQLASDLFDTPDSLIRLDMSEYMEKYAVSRIIGSPPGYVGYDEAGQLTEKVRRKPYCVILFDEIEKAHPDVLNILLQILDDGRITDAHGRVVNFEHSVIVMTSNAGSSVKEAIVGFGRTLDEQDEERTMKALQSFLRPEFLNRVDEIIHFNRLSEEDFKHITEIMLNELKTSLSEKEIELEWDSSVVDYLTHKSYSLTYGARNLRRLIEKELEDVIALHIINSYLEPVHKINVTVVDDKIQLV